MTKFKPPASSRRSPFIWMRTITLSSMTHASAITIILSISQLQNSQRSISKRDYSTPNRISTSIIADRFFYWNVVLCGTWRVWVAYKICQSCYMLWKIKYNKWRSSTLVIILYICSRRIWNHPDILSSNRRDPLKTFLSWLVPSQPMIQWQQYKSSSHQFSHCTQVHFVDSFVFMNWPLYWARKFIHNFWKNPKPLYITESLSLHKFVLIRPAPPPSSISEDTSTFTNRRCLCRMFWSIFSSFLLKCLTNLQFDHHFCS